MHFGNLAFERLENSMVEGTSKVTAAASFYSDFDQKGRQ